MKNEAFVKVSNDNVDHEHQCISCRMERVHSSNKHQCRATGTIINDRRSRPDDCPCLFVPSEKELDKIVDKTDGHIWFRRK